MDTQPPVILLVYANDRVDPSRHLRNLSAEIGLIRDALQPAEQAGLCQVLIEANAGADRIFSVFQDPRYRSRIAVLHYAGHADEYRLMLESAAGGTPADQGAAHAAGLAAFLGEQRGLQLVFLNGCSTAPQVQGLLDAGCPAVIATSQAIDDGVAMEFAARFYQGLGGGIGLESAFKAAVAAARTTHGDSPRGLYWGSASEPTPLAERWPWDFHTKPGADRAQHWNLPEAADDPLFGLPALPQLDLPTSPFRHLSWFDREHAEVFFGRPFQVRELFDRITAPDAPPILLFYGQSGVGKSSVLAAGLLPRLEASHRVHYRRRDPALGLFGTLMQPLGAGVDEPGAAWRQAETDAKAPLLLILDQAEEVFTRPAAKPAEELATFLAGLQAIFGQPQTRPRGRLILSFRKEWLPEIEARLADQRLPRGRLFLEGLDRRGIIAAVEGATRGDRLRNAYGLQIAPGLAAEIADDLLADPGSPIAPTLQILLTKLWEEARRQDFEHPRFTHDLYLKLKRDGILLKDFLDQQLAALAQWHPAVVQSGLALDLLAAHTTPTGTADQRTEQELLTTYTQVQEVIPALVQRCKDGYLLTDLPSTGPEPVKGTRLAHDTIAPLVRARFEESDKPGQRARRILENRAVEWRDQETGAALDEAELAVVEGGVAGMRDWGDDERRLIEASRQTREGRRRAQHRRRALAAISVLALAVAGGFLAWQWQQTERQQRTAIARLQASQAAAEAETNPIRALLLAAEAVKRPFETDGVRLGGPESLLRQIVASTGGMPLSPGGSPFGFAPGGHWLATRCPDDTVCLWDLGRPEAGPRLLQGHQGRVSALAFDHRGHRLATGSFDGKARLWDLADLDAGSRILSGHSGRITALAIDSTDRWLATASEDLTVRLWDLESLDAEPAILRGHEKDVTSLAFAPDGRFLATRSWDQHIQLWDLQRPAAGPQLAPEDCTGIEVLGFSPDARWFAAGTDAKLVRLWHLQALEAGPQVLEGHTDAIKTLAFDPAGRWLATGSRDGTVYLRDLAHAQVEPRILKGHDDWILALAFDPLGRWLATGSTDNTARLWNLPDAKAEPLVLRGHAGWVSKLAFDPQGGWLATGSSDNSVRLWDPLHPDAEPRVLRGHDGSIVALEVDPQGRWLATQGDWVDNWSVRLWALQKPGAEPRVLAGHEGGIRPGLLAVDPGGRWLVAGAGGDTALLWDLQRPATEPRVLRGHGRGVSALTFEHDGLQLATGSIDGTVHLWFLTDPLAAPLVLNGHGGLISALAFDPQGRWLISGSWDKTVRLWDLKDPRVAPRVLPGYEGKIKTLVLDPQGRWLAVDGDDNGARLWDLQDPATEPRVLGGHRGPISTLAFDPQAHLLATGGMDGATRLWDLRQHETEPRVLRGTDEIIQTLAFDPQGRWLATGDVDGVVRLWDIQQPATPPRELRGHARKSFIWALAFDPKGRWLATGDMDKTARLWDLDDPGAEPLVLRGHKGEIRALRFDPQGRWLATGSVDGTVRLWQLDIHPLLDLACRIAGRNLRMDEWRQHVGEFPYQVTCAQFPSGSLVTDNIAPVTP